MRLIGDGLQNKKNSKTQKHKNKHKTNTKQNNTKNTRGRSQKQIPNKAITQNASNEIDWRWATKKKKRVAYKKKRRQTKTNEIKTK